MALVVYGQDEKEKAEFIERFIAKVSPRFIHAYGKEGALGIEDVRQILARSSLSAGTGIQLFILYGANTMTREAQNAFLKILEEPPETSMFLLVSNSLEGFLPTLLSRLSKHRFFRNYAPKPDKKIAPETIQEREEAILFLNEELRALKEKYENAVRAKSDLRVLRGNIERTLELLKLLDVSRVAPRYLIDSYLMHI